MIGAIIAATLLLSGCFLAMLAGVGILRLQDVFGRLHAATKPSALGVLLVCIGAAIVVNGLEARTQLAAVVLLQFFTSPVGAHLLGRSSYEAGLMRQ